MLKRKIAGLIERHFRSGTERILLIDGARQVEKRISSATWDKSCLRTSSRATCWRTPAEAGCLHRQRLWMTFISV